MGLLPLLTKVLHDFGAYGFSDIPSFLHSFYVSKERERDGERERERERPGRNPQHPVLHQRVLHRREKRQYPFSRMRHFTIVHCTLHLSKGLGIHKQFKVHSEQ